ncbi:MAG: DUF4910 domain-containing protein [Fibrobacterota bacterium]
MIEKLVEELYGEADEKRALAYLKKIQSIDKSFTFPGFEKSSAFCARKAASFGLESTIHMLPADGETAFGDWIMPMAWDIKSAAAEIVSPSEAAGEIADRSKIPASTVMWCGPTPKEGIQAKTALITDSKKISPRTVKNKIVITPLAAAGIKKQLIENGALAVISFFLPRPDLFPDAVGWTNTWSDEPTGWVFKATDTPFTGINISPGDGKRLVEKRKKFPGMEISIKCDSRYYRGVLPVTSSLLPGRSRKKEVIGIAHIMEQGANDNASGSAVLLEAARMLSLLVKKGVLKKPRNSIRFLFTAECYGTVGFAASCPEITERTYAGLCADCVGGDPAKVHSEMIVHKTPDSVFGFADELLEKIYSGLNKIEYMPVDFKSFDLGDNILTDPSVDIQTPYMGVKDAVWHTTADRPEIISSNILKRSAAVTAAYLYTAANAKISDVREIFDSMLIAASARCLRARKGKWPSAEIGYTVDLYRAKLKKTAAVFGTPVKEVSKYLKALSGLRKEALRGLPEKKPSRLKKAEKLIPVRLLPFTFSFTDKTAEDLKKNKVSMWSPRLMRALFRTDGKKSLADIIELCELETGAPQKELYGIFKALEKMGKIKIKKKK